MNHSHSASFPIFLIVVALVLLTARLVSKFTDRLGLPSVLGELAIGVILGALPVIGTEVHQNTALQFMAELGAILLLFEAGLKSTFGEIKQVGGAASRVALVGVIVPLALGVVVSWMFGAVETLPGHIFIGATLTATSVGITARVLMDLGFSKSVESKIIMAAAVFDDILGLVLLSFVTALVQTARGGEMDWKALPVILVKTGFFITVCWILGTTLVPQFFRWVQKVLDKPSIFLCGLALCFISSLLAHVFGLAPILGAYFAGLMIDPKELDELMEKHLNPLSLIFVPMFFVMMGAKVDLSFLGDLRIHQLGIVLTLVAVFGKVVSGYVISKDLNRLVVGVGMVPRGEVGLIFASMGVSPLLGAEPVFSPHVFGAIVLMVVITSIVSPIWLGRLLKSNRAR